MSTLSGPERPDLLKDEFLHDVFLLTASRYPNKVALRWKDEEITYYQLHQNVLQLAFILQEKKQIGPGSLVGIWLSRSALLHVAILAVLTTGATYVPFDADAPHERVSEVLEDLQVVLLLVDSRAPVNHPLAVNIDLWREDMQIVGNVDPKPSMNRDYNSMAYIICTSGSTGKPKAIAISHRSICHFLRADNEVMQIRNEDIVYQGSSSAFDMFLEETFLSYSVGATLVIPSKMDVLSSDRLHLFFIRHSITVLFCVPTLLLLMNNDPTIKLRMINAGGEACSQVIVDRWWKEGRIIFNSYGPTEITVAATAQSLRPGQPISIGTPLPNYVCCLLDEVTGQPTSETTGELCISGPGVALGYVNRESLTKEKFTEYGYRTGDRVSIRDGQIFFHERIDSQVKLRGFRIELDEIEQELRRLDDRVVEAAVAVLNEQLVAFVVGKLSESTMREELRQRLPSYMVPDRLIKLDRALPRLHSGKIDRKALASLLELDSSKKKETNETKIELETAFQFLSRWLAQVLNELLTKTVSNLENVSTNKMSTDQNPSDIVLNAFQRSFPHLQPKANDDFFLDLGGHSLIAALAITELRKSFPSVALHDLYECRTAEKLAERLIEQSSSHQKEKTTNTLPTFPKISYTRCILCSLVQAIVCIILCAVASLDLVLPYIVFVLSLNNNRVGYACLAAYAVFLIVPLVRLLLAFIVKWVIVGRYKEGDYPLWGCMYVRWWIVEQFSHLSVQNTLANSPLLTVYYRLLGAKIGQNVHLGVIHCPAPDLLEIGDESTISSDVHFQTAFVENYTLKFRRIFIQKNVSIGNRSVLGGQTRMEENSELSLLTFLPPNTSVPSGEVWHGSPAVYSHQVHSTQATDSIRANDSIGALATIIFGLLALIFIPLVYFIPMIPGLLLFEYVDLKKISSWNQIFIFGPIVGILYTCLVVLETIIVRYLIVGTLKEGVYSTKSITYIRKWLFDQVLDIALHVIYTFYATLYITPFFRMLGMKIGQRCEISTAIGMVHTLVELGDECFIADNVLLCDPEIHSGQMHLKVTTIGNRVFIGNSAIIPDGKHIPNHTLIACMSLLADGIQEKQSCLGSPSFILPKRAEAPSDIDENLTYHPSKWLIFQRFCMDTVRVFLPRIIMVIEIGMSTEIFEYFSPTFHFFRALLILPLLQICVIALPSLLLCILFKWLLIGKYRKKYYPLWSWFVWISDFVSVAYHQLAVPLVLDFLQGTLFLPAILRCFGVKIGRGCYVNTSEITEFDLIHIGNQVALNAYSELQTHLFEDRVMKLADVYIEDKATIGCASIMLPDTRLGSGAYLAPLSLVIKGETISARTSWQGIPVREYN